MMQDSHDLGFLEWAYVTFMNMNANLGVILITCFGVFGLLESI